MAASNRDCPKAFFAEMPFHCLIKFLHRKTGPKQARDNIRGCGCLANPLGNILIVSVR